MVMVNHCMDCEGRRDVIKDCGGKMVRGCL